MCLEHGGHDVDRLGKLVGVLAGLGVVVAAPPPAALAGPGTVDWARQIGGSGVVDTVSSVDTAGTSTFVAGRFTNSITLDGTTITAPNNADGYVAYPDINVVEEMANMITAMRSYEASSSSIGTVKNMFNKALEIGR